VWEAATATLAEVAAESGLELVPDPGGAAFYGPKISVQARDAIGRTWQMSTIQLDFNLPERFELEYQGADGERHRPVMIHRALMGSYERFIGILLEHVAGELPVWLAPVQAIVLPISDRHIAYGETVARRLREAGIRVELDQRTESVSRKIRDAELRKIPYMGVVGDREQESDELSLREHRRGDVGSVSVQSFAARVQAEVKSRSAG
jgi:threonyl-tRNA synthetase